MHAGAAEDEPERVRVVQQHHLNHFRGTVGCTFRCEIHRGRLGPPVYPGTPIASAFRMRVALPAVLVFLIAVVVRHPTAESIIVPAKGDLQAALNKARPGDTILLERDATYVGNFVLPAAKGDDDRVITLRTAGEVDNAGDGQRISPASA